MLNGMKNITGAMESLQHAVAAEGAGKRLFDLENEIEELKARESESSSSISSMMAQLLERQAEQSSMLQTLIKDTHKVPTLVFFIRELPSGLRRASPLRLVRNTYRLFFICSHTHQIVHCGPDGMGYLIKVPKAWVKYAAPVLQVSCISSSVRASAASCFDCLFRSFDDCRLALA